MKRIIIYRGLVVAVLLMVTSVARAEIVGIKDESECLVKIWTTEDLTKALLNLSPQAAADYYDQKNNRFIFCMKMDLKTPPEIITQTTLANNSQYPVIIYNLKINSSKKNPDGSYKVPTGTSLLTTTGRISIQNLKAENLRAPIVIGGSASMRDGTVSCDPLNTTPAITVSSSYSVFRNIAINECVQGLNVTGSFNAFYEVTIQKTVATEGQAGEWGVTSTGKSNQFYALQVLNYLTGANLAGDGDRITGLADGQTVLPSTIHGFIKTVTAMDGSKTQSPLDDSVGVIFQAAGVLEASDVSSVESGALVLANNVIIQKNLALGGTIGAIVIGHNGTTDAVYSPVVASQNTYTTQNTITYVNPEDAKARTLLSVEWIGKHVPVGKDYADRVVGKLMNQKADSAMVEYYLNAEPKINESYHLNFVQTCPVMLASEPITITMTDSYGSKSTEQIQSGEKYFDCSLAPDGSSLNVPLAKVTRFMFSSPLSTMTDHNTLSAIPDITVFISGASTIAPEGGGLMDSGSTPSPQPSSTGGGGSYGQSDMGGGGGNDAKIPDTTPMNGEGEAESGGGSAMTGGAMALGGDAAPAAAGASAGCGGMLMDIGPLTLTLSHMGRGEYYGVILWWLVPMVGLWYRRKKVG